MSAQTKAGSEPAHTATMLAIVRKLASLRAGLENSNSSAEEAATRLAAEADALLAELEKAHG